MEEYKKYLPMTLETRDSYDLWLKYDDEYLVSVTSQKVKALNYLKRGIVYELPISTNNKGYKTVHLHRKNILLHRVIMKAIHGEIPKDIEVDHVNTDPSDNHFLNLRLCTRKENMNNPITYSRIARNNKDRMKDDDYREAHYRRLDKLHNNEEAQKKLKEGIRRRSQNQEWKENVKKASQNRSQEWKENVRKALQNKSQEWRKNISAAKKKQFEDPEFLEKYRVAMRNRSEEWRHNSTTALKKKLSKPVMQFDLQGNLIKEWPSSREIERVLGYNRAAIYQCIKGKYKQAYGFIWRYA